MDATALIGNAQDAYVAGLQKQTAAQAAAVKGTSAKGAANLKSVHDTAEKFEAFFIGQMMEHMTAGLETDETFGGGHGEEMWKSMLNQEYGKQIAKSGKLGIASKVMTGMLRAQEERTAAQTAAVAAIAPPANATDALSEQDAAVATVAGVVNPIRR